MTGFRISGYRSICTVQFVKSVLVYLFGYFCQRLNKHQMTSIMCFNFENATLFVGSLDIVKHDDYTIYNSILQSIHHICNTHIYIERIYIIFSECSNHISLLITTLILLRVALSRVYILVVVNTSEIKIDYYFYYY